MPPRQADRVSTISTDSGTRGHPLQNNIVDEARGRMAGVVAYELLKAVNAQ